MNPRDVLLRAIASPFGIELTVRDKAARDRVRAKLYRERTAMRLGDQISISTSRETPDTALWIVHRAKETGSEDDEGNAPDI